MNKLTACVLITAIIACSNPGKNTESQDTAKEAVDTSGSITSSAMSARAAIMGTNSDTLSSGKADFVQKEDGTVEMSLQLKFPKKANQNVAVHFHEHPDCSNNAEGAHGHWNPTNEPHGKWEPAAHHSGDIGNIRLDAQGNGAIKLSSDRWSIGGDEKTDIINRAIIVHAGEDDYTTQPSGNSGSRIGCGLIQVLSDATRGH